PVLSGRGTRPHGRRAQRGPTRGFLNMDERLMNAMLELDDRHWWYRGRRRIIRAELDRLPVASGGRVLDAGCGSGRTLEELGRYGEVFGIELDPGAADVARARGCGEVTVGRLEELPWEDGAFELITCLDVDR